MISNSVLSFTRYTTIVMLVKESLCPLAYDFHNFVRNPFFLFHSTVVISKDLRISIVDVFNEYGVFVVDCCRCSIYYWWSVHDFISKYSRAPTPLRISQSRSQFSILWLIVRWVEQNVYCRMHYSFLKKINSLSLSNCYCKRYSFCMKNIILKSILPSSKRYVYYCSAYVLHACVAFVLFSDQNKKHRKEVGNTDFFWS